MMRTEFNMGLPKVVHADSLKMNKNFGRMNKSKRVYSAFTNPFITEEQKLLNHVNELPGITYI